MTPAEKRKKNMTAKEIITNAKDVTVINDGQFRYPVLTTEMRAWVAANGPITAANYDAFCGAVDCLGEREIGTPGNAAMIDFCATLIEAGADTEAL